MVTLLVVGAWLWLVPIALLVAIAVAWRANPARSRRAGVLVAASVLVLVEVFIFGVLPELALSGELSDSRGLSPCDESPGSGCSACTTSAAAAGLSDDECWEQPLTAWGVTVGGLGPFTRGEALTLGAEHQPRFLERAGLRAGSR